MTTAPRNEDDGGPERLGETDASVAELERLVELAPEPWTTPAPGDPRKRPMSRVHITFDKRGNVAEYVLRPSDEAARRGWQAMMLAPTIEICQALLRGESVPVDQLRPEWVKRLGRRPR